MQGHKPPPESSLFVYGDPYARLPRSGFYEALAKQLDLEWVREATRGLYAEGIGRPSLDPVVFVKLMLVGYFENLVGDSELAFRVADSLTVRRFLGYGLGEPTPERTTILKCRQRWPIAVFEAIFSRVLAQLAQQGLVKGEHLGTDTVLIDANASMDSLRHREFGCSYAEFVKALYAQPTGAAPAASEVASKDAGRPGKASNADWVSGTDPEAAVAVHPDGHTALCYRLDATVDLETGAIVQIAAESGNVRDNVDVPQRLAEAQANLAELGLTPTALTADRGHHSAENIVELETMGISPIIRQRAQAGPAGFREQDFEYRGEEDEYRCPAGVRLTRRKCSPGPGRVHYRAKGDACRQCEHFGVCTKSTAGRSIVRTAHYEEVENNAQRVRSLEGRTLLGAHRQRAEGPWSYAKLYGGLARLGPRGLTNAWKKALIQGIGWNLMKLVARLTGLAPRGRSALAQLLAASIAYVRGISTQFDHACVQIHIRLRLRRSRGYRYQTQSLSRRCLLSRGC